MPYKKDDPTWSGYMGDYLRGNVGINQLKPQHEFFDAIGLEKALRDNVQYEALISVEEAVEILEDINPPTPVNGGDRDEMLRIATGRQTRFQPFLSIPTLYHLMPVPFMMPPTLLNSLVSSDHYVLTRKNLRLQAENAIYGYRVMPVSDG
ncbi:MAG: hypothetical protein RR510_14590 [Morganella sp. (in: enterobacteria)]